MKKLSTVRGRESKIFNEHNLTIGLDLGDRSSYYCVLETQIGTQVATEAARLKGRNSQEGREEEKPTSHSPAFSWKLPTTQQLAASDNRSSNFRQKD